DAVRARLGSRRALLRLLAVLRLWPQRIAHGRGVAREAARGLRSVDQDRPHHASPEARREEVRRLPRERPAGLRASVRLYLRWRHALARALAHAARTGED